MPRLRTLLLGALPLFAAPSLASTTPPPAEATVAPTEVAPAPTQPVPLGPDLAWRWPAELERTYHIDLALVLPEPLLLEGPGDTSANLTRLDLRLLTRCSAIEENPAGWRLLCMLSDVALQGQATAADAGKLGPILALAETELQRGALDIQFRRDGRLMSLALAGLETRDRRLTRLHDTLRLLLERALMGLELVTPASWSGGWSSQGSGILTYVPRAQSLGVTRLVMRASDPPDAGQLRFEVEGRGVVQASTLAARQGRDASNSMSMGLASSGSLIFDATGGELVERRWAVLGRPSANANLSGEYIQSGLLRLLEPGDALPELGPSGERDPAAPATDAWLAWEAVRPALEQSLGGERVIFEP